MPVDPASVPASTDEHSLAFAANDAVQTQLLNSVPLSQVDASEYAAVVFPGTYFLLLVQAQLLGDMHVCLLFIQCLLSMYNTC